MSLINVDLDGVVYPFHEVFSDYLYRKFGDAYDNFEVDEITDWNMAQCWGFTKSEWLSWFRRGVEEGVIWYDGEPIEGARETLWKLSDRGHTLRVVTTRLAFKHSHAAIISATVNWLDKHNIPYHDIAFVGKTNKGTYRADYAIDDSIANYLDYIDAGVDAFIFKRPWNQSQYSPIGSWDDFYYQIHQDADL